MFCAVPQGFQGPMLPASLDRAEPPSREVLCYLITFKKTYQAKFLICMLQAFSHFQNDQKTKYIEFLILNYFS